MDRSSKQTFNFVNLSHPDELKDEGTQIRIRRFAMAEVGKARRKPKTRRERNEIVLEVREAYWVASEHLNLERLGCGEFDPFIRFPIDLNDSSRELIANIFRSNSSHQKVLRGSWFPVGLFDAAAFNCVLANSQLYVRMEQSGSYISEDDSDSLYYHNKCIALVAKKLCDPNQSTSDALVGGIGSLMCHDQWKYIIGAFERHNLHKRALIKILELRGGIDSITREELRITLSWCDLVGAFSQDIPPIFPMPSRWEVDSRSPPSSPKPHVLISLVWKKHMPMEFDWISIFDDIAQLISLDRAFTDQAIVAATTSGSWMEPTMIRLLSIRPLYRSNTRERIMEEICRLGMLLFLSPLWRKMGATPVYTAAFTRNLLWVLNNHMVEWGDLKPLLVWTIYFATIETSNLFERNQFVFMLAVLMNGMQIKEWEELIQVVQNVLWVESVFASSDEVIRDEVMAIMTAVPLGSVSGQLQET
ncbi:hypothetical protein CC78DRAFT_539961 [Lojkania enalia]|uniref:Uncharacterized protein n=1 Tax=Lojkania enalia TaxID=147567 RepID=A0A9P4NA48_9PLEO|nr:hypothetical protein CC78DRAFT_539961 [Didymosphaeria enalia]